MLLGDFKAILSFARVKKGPRGSHNSKRSRPFFLSYLVFEGVEFSCRATAL